MCDVSILFSQKVLRHCCAGESTSILLKEKHTHTHTKSYLVPDSSRETSNRVLICSETTPTARKATHARPAPMPNRLVKAEAIQSVDSAVVLTAGFGSAALAAADGAGGGGGDGSTELS